MLLLLLFRGVHCNRVKEISKGRELNATRKSQRETKTTNYKLCVTIIKLAKRARMSELILTEHKKREFDQHKNLDSKS